MFVRASIGTLAVLKLIDLKMLEKPHTAYILQYSKDGCSAECLFCPQSRINISNKSLVSRVPWPKIKLESLIRAIKLQGSPFARICVQNVIKEEFEEEFVSIVKQFKINEIRALMSASITPVSDDILYALKEYGIEHLGIGLDAATPEVFKRVKKPYSWNVYIDFIKRAIKIFGRRKVDVHLILGMGETEREFVETMKMFAKEGADIALFAFTPIKGTLMGKYKQPPIEVYRKIQLINYLLRKGVKIDRYVYYDGDKVCLNNALIRELERNIDEYMEAFLTSGCPSCNRPFYNERPSGPFYNLPSMRFAQKLKLEILREIRKISGVCKANET